MKYIVTFYYHTDAEVEVEADSREEAIEKAYIEVGSEDYDSQIIHNVQEDADPDIEEIEDGE